MRRVIAAVGASALLGLIGDFMCPLAPFNVIAFLAAFGLVTISVVVRVKRGIPFGTRIRLFFATFIAIAAVFGIWCGLALLYGDREKGYLAEHYPLVRRLQSAIFVKDDEKPLPKAEDEPLVGEWVHELSDAVVGTEADLRIKGNKLTWRIPLPQGRSRVRIEAEYSITREGVGYGVVTEVDYGTADAKLKRQLPREDDPFSFRFRSVKGRAINVAELKGRGFEELAKAAEGRYERTE